MGYVLAHLRPLPLAPGQPVGQGTQSTASRRVGVNQSPQFDQTAFEDAFADALTPILIVTATGEVEWANRAFTAQTGYTAAALAAEPGWSFGVPAPALHAGIRETILNRRIWRGRALNRRLDSSSFIEETTIVPVPGPDGAIVRGVVLKRDLTDLARRRDLSDEIRDCLEMAGGSGFIGVWDWDIRSRTQRFNQAFHEMLGYTTGELSRIDNTWRDLIHPEDKTSVNQILIECLSGRRREFDAIFRLRHKLGGFRKFRGRGRVIARDSNGTPLRFIGTITPAAEGPRPEGAHQRPPGIPVGLLPTGLAHDLNNVFTVISGYASMIASDVPDSAREPVEKIVSAALHGATMIQPLLTLKKEAQAGHIAGLNTILRVTGRILTRVIRRDIDLVLKIDADPDTIGADRDRMEQIIMTLVTNVLAAIPAGGKLILQTTNFEVDPEFANHHPELNPGKYILLVVTNTGSAMSAGAVAPSFEGLLLSQQDQGYGLGATYRAIIQNGGLVYVETEHGRSTTFQILFPAVIAPSEPRP